MRRLLLLVTLVSCGQLATKIEPNPNVTIPPPEVTVTPAPGPFNDKVTLTFQAEEGATIYLSQDGNDPRNTSAGRVSGPSPLTVVLEKTTSVRYFASAGGRDGELREGTWVRAGGKVGTISGVLVVGDFVVGQKIAIVRGTEVKDLTTPTKAAEIPFVFEGVMTGTHRLVGMADRDADGQLLPILDFTSDPVNVEIDLADPFKASAENVRVYLGASSKGLGTLRGIITLPKPPEFQNLQISLLSPSAFTGGLDPQSLLQQLQSGYRIFTNAEQTDYPYVITDLKPGQYLPVPSLFGLGTGGVALNFVANPLKPAVVKADEETVQNFAFGPITLTGEVTVSAASAPAGIAYGAVVARSGGLLDGIQAVLMPVLFQRNSTTQDITASYTGSALRANQTVSMRAFINTGMANPVVDALTWAINPFSSTPAQATITTTTADVTKDIVIP